jgi:hypothetical protein
MAEKKGNTVKLKYDFPSQRSCEVYIPSLENWFRVTPREFRSWVGSRRILHITNESKLDQKTHYEEYDGPTYLFESNIKINPSKYPQGKIAFLHDKDPREAKLRNHEQHLLP